ncbi:MAG TPA: glutamine amidotransferase [Propionibacteriaceae bacterium]|nr:glutamine amidotransferase [Propionibacteriaceae bacterium]
MLPYLLLATRDHDEAADAEYASILRHSGLVAKELQRVRLEAAPLPAIDLAAYSGVILGGSSFNVSDTVKSPLQQRVEADLDSLLTRIVTKDIPFLGLCYGVGALTVHLGGTVNREFAEPVGATRITLTRDGLADPVLAGAEQHFEAFVGHKEACSQLPSTVTMLAVGLACPVQMYRVGRNVYVTQFHPELDVADLAARMRIYQHAGYFAPEELDTLVAMAHDSGVTGQQHLVLRNFVQRYRRDV